MNNDNLIFEFNCVWIYVSDVKRAIEFYKGILGLKLVFTDTETGWAEFKIGESSTHIACQEWGKTPETMNIVDKGKSYYTQPRIVFKTNNLNSTINNLKKFQIKVSSIQELKNVFFVNLKDFDGNLLQIIEEII